MRRLVLFCILHLFIGYINAQVVENPVFDRTDVYEFRVQKIETKNDTTYVYCSYSADAGSWANISDKTYIENVNDGTKYPIIKVTGIPFSPDKRHFNKAGDIDVKLYFPCVYANRINIIENEDESAFNIYGIDLTCSYDSTYTTDDIHYNFDAYQKKEKEEDWASALKYTQNQLEATDYVEGIRSFASACSLYNMMMVLYKLNEYDKEIECGLKAIDILRELPQDSIYLDVLARAYGNVGTAYSLMKQPDIAEEYMELSLATRRLKEGVGVYTYEEYLRELAERSYYEDNYPKALLYGKELVDIYEKKYNENQIKYECAYIAHLGNLIELYNSMGKTEEAVNTGRLALELSNKGRCDDYSWLKYGIYNNLGIALIDQGEIDEGIRFLEMAVSAGNRGDYSHDLIFQNSRLVLAATYLYNKQDTLRALQEYEFVLKEIEDSISSGNSYSIMQYIRVLNKLFEIYMWSDPDIAILYLDKAINVYKERVGESSIGYANMLIKKVEMLWIPSLYEKKDLDSLLLYISQVSEIVKRHINNSAFNMSRKEQKNYWHRYSGLFTWFIPTISGILNTDFGNSLAYDAALFYKGMLLSSEREFKRVIQTCNDNELNELYREYTINLAKLEKLYSENSRSQTVDSLESIIKGEEFLLSQKVTRFSRQYKGTDYSWKEIKKQLKKGDVAIEILSYRGLDGQDIYYDAYVIDSDSKSPQLIRLCSENQLKSLITDSIDYKGLSMLLWGDKKLQDALVGTRNIYFSTTGLLNTIGIEYLPIAGNKYIYDRFNLYRLSSTRELCMRCNAMTVDNAYLYGGLDYNDKVEQPKYKEAIPYRLSRSAIESLTQRGGFDLLMGSMQEVELIKSTLSKHKIECVVLSGSAGTEESIKELSGNYMGILHLSTHGMYIPDNNDSIRDANNYRFIILDEAQFFDEEEISLSHSFLVMSGGNALIHRDSISVDNEDGILTALEISHLDFTNLDLVVLSACETALGRIDSEGVYGLQRGFKKAGANTIVMSLDKVDDEATRILMVEFYRNLMNGKTKHQSLQDAQQYLRKFDNGKYDDPKYWASFIMLDGLN